MPRISVCIPTYNRAPMLRESIASVLEQTFSDFEIVISDNASTDNTSDTVSRLKDVRIRYYRQPVNLGIARNYQACASMASAEFVAFLCDDDLYLPEHLDMALEALAEFPQAIYYSCPVTMFGSGAQGELRPFAITDRVTPRLFFPPGRVVDFLGGDLPGLLNTLVCKREALQDLFWGERGYINVDTLIMTQLMVQGGFVFGNRPTGLYRIHPTNISHSSKLSALRTSCMLWHGIRYLAGLLLTKGFCTLADIENHGMQSPCDQHVVPLVLALGSFYSPDFLRTMARRIFEARTDMDVFSSRFRLARRLGFWAIPLSEKISQFQTGWHP